MWNRKGGYQVSSWTGASRNKGKNSPVDYFSDAAWRIPLEYIKADEIEEKLEQNREESQKQHKGFITTEMLYVLSEYKKQMEKEEKNISQEGTER